MYCSQQRPPIVVGKGWFVLTADLASYNIITLQYIYTFRLPTYIHTKHILLSLYSCPLIHNGIDKSYRKAFRR